jgi:hypothetical protein
MYMDAACLLHVNTAADKALCSDCTDRKQNANWHVFYCAVTFFLSLVSFSGT